MILIPSLLSQHTASNLQLFEELFQYTKYPRLTQNTGLTHIQILDLKVSTKSNELP